MAAQEKTKQAQMKPPPKQEPTDLLMTFDPPATGGTAPPPVFDSSMLPPPAATDDAPPPFEAVQDHMHFPPPPPIEAVAPPPPIDSLPPPTFNSVAAPSAPMFAPSAPAFEDLLDSHPAPPPLSGMQAVPPPAAPEPQIDEDVLAALDPAEREALLEEQRQIMAQIEKDKAGNMASGAAARALAFDQRSNAAVAQAAGMMDRPGGAVSQPPRRRAAAPASSSASGGRTVDLGSGQTVPLHGQEKTEQAIKDGTAALVQCVNCQNWMQVTGNATLMFCPVCQVVSPVERADGATTAANLEQAAQMDADQKLAEQLQQEEYKQAGGGGSSSTRRPKPKKQEAAEEGQSWYDWIVGNPAPAAKASSPARTQQRSPGLVSAQTGEERGGYSGSSGGVGGGARVAESKSMFACVADSVATAATAITATTLTQDGEGNVHGVDSSSLLAMPQVGRQQH